MDDGMGVQSGGIPVELHELIGRLERSTATGAQRWLLRVMRAHGPDCIRLLWRMLGDEHMVMDVYQESVYHLARLDTSRRPKDPGGYFYRCAVNVAVDQIRRRRRQRAGLRAIAEARHSQQRGDSPLPEGVGPADEPEAAAALRRAVLALPPHLRNVVVLHDLAEMPHARVARILGIGVGTSRVYRRQAILRLTAMLGRGGGS